MRPGLRHDVSGKDFGPALKIWITIKQPSLQVGQVCESREVAVDGPQGAGNRVAIKARQRLSLSPRTRLDKKPNWRMRTKPVGSTWSRKRRKNSTASSVMFLVRERSA